MDTIEINLTQQEADRRKRRLEAFQQREKVSPLPMTAVILESFFLEKIGISLKDFLGNPEIMLRAQILCRKYVLETISCDNFTVDLTVPFSREALSPSALGCELTQNDSGDYWALPWIETDQDLLKLEKIDCLTAGLQGKSVDMRRAMMELKNDYQVCFRGGDPFLPAANIALRDATDGPFTLACELVGTTKFFTDLVDRPRFCKDLIRIVTEKEIQWIEFCKKETGQPQEGISIADDFAVYLSREMYEEFALPYEKQIREHFSGYCTFHFCVLANHLLRYLLEDLAIDNFWGFAPQVPLPEYVPALKNLLNLMGDKVNLCLYIDISKSMAMRPEELYKTARLIVEELMKYKGTQVIFGATAGMVESKVLECNATITRAIQDAASDLISVESGG